MKKFLSSFFDKHFFLFLLVGIGNTIFGYLIFASLIFINLHYSLAALIAFCIGTCFSFKTIGSLVFKNNDNMLIFRFISVYFSLYWINIGTIRILKITFDNLYLCGAISVVFVAALSYIFNRYFIFAKIKKASISTIDDTP